MDNVRELHAVESGDVEEGPGIIFTRAKVQIQPAVEEVADTVNEPGGQRLLGFWLRATEVDADGGELEDARTAHVPIDVGAMRLLIAAVGDYLDSLEQSQPGIEPNVAGELIVAPASALSQLGRQQRRDAERAGRRPQR